MTLLSIITQPAALVTSKRAAEGRARSTPKKKPKKHRWHTVAAIGAVSCLLLGGTTGAAAAETVDDLDLGPRVVKTDAGPTGYSVTFRYDAPDGVESVRIWGEWQFSDPETITATGRTDGRWGSEWKPGDVVAPAGPGFLLSDMIKGEDGVWTWTTPLPSGTFSYHFVHDDCPGPSNSSCTRFVDPANPGWASQLTPTGAQTFSQVHVPANPRFPTYDYPAQVPTTPERTGTFEHRQYVSPASTSPAGSHYAVVYLPAGYDSEREVPYPTLYLSHGLGGNEAHWSQQGLSNHIMENLVAEGEAQPMVIVSTNFNGLAGDAGYAQDMIQNVIPFIENEYNVSESADDRAFGGQSLGGTRGLNLLYNNTPTFGYYGLWAAASSALPTAPQVENLKGVRGGIHLGTGLQDLAGNIGPNSVLRAQALRSQGVPVVEYNVDGTHTWDAARQLYEDFLRRVAFRTTEVSLSVDTRDGVKGISARVDPLGTSQAVPTGSVEFRRGDAVIASAAVGADGTAHLPLDRESGAVEVRYLGDDRFNSSEGSLELPLDVVRPTVSLAAPLTAGPFSRLKVQVDASDAGGLSQVVANVYQGAKLVTSTQTAVPNGATSATHTADVELPEGNYTVRYNAHDLADNVSKTGVFDFAIDTTNPTAAIKDGSAYTVKTGEAYDLISFKLSDAQKVEKVELNGKVKDLSNNAWSDINYVKPGVFGAVKGANTLVVFDVAGNTQAYTFILN